MMNPVVRETIERCRTAGLRRTKALEELVSTLLESQRPMTLSELASSKRLTDQCDKATVFRLLQRLTEHGLIRRLGLHVQVERSVRIDDERVAVAQRVAEWSSTAETGP